MAGGLDITMNEPINPDQYWVYIGPATLEGKKGQAKIKKWYDSTKKEYSRILSFERDMAYEGENNATDANKDI